MRGVHTRVTRSAFDTGFLEDARNIDLSVAGEVRRRRGYTRTNIQKKSAQIDSIAGFSSFGGDVLAALIDGDRLQGYEDVAAAEPIAQQLGAPSGHYLEYYHARYWIAVTRGDENRDIDGFEVFAKQGSTPVSATEDGVRAAGFIAIDRNSYAAQGYWYAPEDAAWKFAARAIRGDDRGPLGALSELTGVTLDQDGVDYDDWDPAPPPAPPNPPAIPPIGGGGGDPARPGQPIDAPAQAAPQWSFVSSYVGAAHLNGGTYHLLNVAQVTISAAQANSTLRWTVTTDDSVLFAYALLDASDYSTVKSAKEVANGTQAVETNVAAGTYLLYVGIKGAVDEATAKFALVELESETSGGGASSSTSSVLARVTADVDESEDTISATANVNLGTLADDTWADYTSVTINPHATVNYPDAYGIQGNSLSETTFSSSDFTVTSISVQMNESPNGGVTVIATGRKKFTDTSTEQTETPWSETAANDLRWGCTEPTGHRTLLWAASGSLTKTDGPGNIGLSPDAYAYIRFSRIRP